jgi:hypothetical protein
METTKSLLFRRLQSRLSTAALFLQDKGAACVRVVTT